MSNKRNTQSLPSGACLGDPTGELSFNPSKGERKTRIMRPARLVPLVLVLLFGGLALQAAKGEKRDDSAPGQVRQLTFGKSNDEDGAFTLADDGTVHFAWISNRAGNLDVWMTSSKDGIKWSDPRPAVQTPTEDLLNSLVRTKDGRYHLTGRLGSWATAQYAVFDSSSTDLIHWTNPVQWSGKGSNGFFQEAPNGDYWLMTASSRSGNQDLYIQRSRDKGKTWNAPTALTNDPLQDFLFGFRIAHDGTFLLVWERHKGRSMRACLGKSTDIYFESSPDDVHWKPPVLVTPKAGKPEADTIPSLIDAPDGQIYAVWLTTRGAPKVQVVAAPVWPHPDLTNIRRLPAEGYSVRGQTLRDGRFILAWVRTVSGSNHEYFY